MSGLTPFFMLFAVVVGAPLIQWHLRQTYGPLVVADERPERDVRRRVRRARLLGIPAALCVYAEMWFLLDAYFVMCGLLPGSGGDGTCVATPTATERLLAVYIGPAAVIVTGLIAVRGAGFRWYSLAPVAVVTFASMIAVVLLGPLAIGAPLVWVYLPSWIHERACHSRRRSHVA